MVITTLPVANDRLLHVKEAAALLNLHPKSVYRYIEKGALEAVRYPTGVVRVRLSVVLAFSDQPYPVEDDSPV